MKKFIQDENGQGMVEYGLIIALVAVAVIAAVRLLAPSIKNIFSEASGALGGETLAAGD